MENILMDAIDIQKKIYDDEMVKILNNFINYPNINEYYKLYEMYENENISCVYFIRNLTDNNIKIGKTINLNRRLYELNLMGKNFSTEISLDRIIICSKQEISKIESCIHKIYKSYNIHGEWFDISEYIDDYYFNTCTYDNKIGDILKINFSYDEFDYDLLKDLNNSMASIEMINDMLPIKVYIEKKYTNSKIYKLYSYMKNNNINFSIYSQGSCNYFVFNKHASKIITMDDIVNKVLGSLIP